MESYLEGLDREFARMRSKECLQKSADRSVVDVGIVYEDEKLLGECRTSMQPIASAQDLDLLLDRKSSFRTPLILYSLASSRSLLPLNVTEDLLKDIFLTHEILPEFLQIISCFYARDDNGAEESFCPPFLEHRTTTKIEYAFAFKYPEYHGRELVEPWSIRQSACYVQHSLVDDTSVVILISPVLESRAYKRIKHCISLPTATAERTWAPYQIIDLLISSHLSDWRDYMSHYEKQIQEIEHRLLSPRPESAFSHTSHLESLQDLHFVQTRLAAMGTALEALDTALQHLLTLGGGGAGSNLVVGPRQQQQPPPGAILSGPPPPPPHPILQALRNRRAEATAYHRALRVVTRRGHGVAELFDRALTQRMAATAQGQSEHVLDLTRSTVDDSVTVRAITVISLVYLSFTVVGVSLLFSLTFLHQGVVETVMDMPFFSIDADTGALELSPQIWIFFLVSVPLTLVTVGYWQWMLELKKREQRRRRVEREKADG